MKLNLVSGEGELLQKENIILKPISHRILTSYLFKNSHNTSKKFHRHFDEISWLQWYLPLRITHSVFSFHYQYPFYHQTLTDPTFVSTFFGIRFSALNKKFLTPKKFINFTFVCQIFFPTQSTHVGLRLLGDLPDQVHLFSFSLEPYHQVREGREPEEILRRA